ncbi:hypothetical protein XELAEV_18029569mg [Xenopus laevis]|uniref:Uncharacterized protein n=1 Tax=Xenopus laevis TaxID=8355 RepID=A0A974CS72_XENLA|nr:hypothetical protein XELAEV_18029569mg [Xenopus laevis]
MCLCRATPMWRPRHVPLLPTPCSTPAHWKHKLFHGEDCLGFPVQGAHRSLVMLGGDNQCSLTCWIF